MPAIHRTDVHAIGILLAGLLPLAVLFWSRGWPRMTVIRWLCHLAPVLLLGAVAGQLLNARGSPVSEWAFPALATMLLATFVPSARIRTIVCGFCLVAALVLCWNFVEVTQSDYTAEPTITGPLSQIANAAAISRARAVLEAREANAGELPVGRIEQDLKGAPIEPKLPVLVSLWHTPWTRLKRIDWEQAEIWSTGKKAKGKPVVEVRRVDLSQE